MIVPVVVPHSRATVLNQTIIYSDTVLSLKELGNNIKVTTIENITDTNLETCLKIIFKSNPDVIFNTIQYSQKEEKVYIYADKEINKMDFEKSKLKKYKPILSTSQILEEIKRALTSEEPNESNCISLYDVARLISATEYEYTKTTNHYQYLLKEKIHTWFGSSSSIVIYDFDHETNELRIGFKYISSYDEIKLTKKDGDLYIKESECYKDKELFSVIASELSNLYDHFIKLSAFKQESALQIIPVNSNFLVNISNYGVGIFTKSPTNIEIFSPSYNNKYRYDCNSEKILSILQDNPKELFQKIYIKISDCPKWSQEKLYEIRQIQLEEQALYEAKQRRKQKILELPKKIFSRKNK